MPKKIFSKPALSPEEQISLYKRRGLIIDDPLLAISELKSITYYRLSGYAKYFTQDSDEKHHFIPGTRFEDIINLYDFDDELRVLIMRAISRIEIAFRGAISDNMSVMYGPHWYLNSDHFEDRAYHDRFLLKVKDETGFNVQRFSFKEKKQSNIFKSYFKKYSQPPLPASWMIAEALSIGTWSIIFERLKKKNKKLISKAFNLHPELLQSWMHSLSYLRNLCAHHVRCWNMHFKIAPIEQKINRSHFLPNHSLYAQLSVIKVLLDAMPKRGSWMKDLSDLLKRYPRVPREKMGFPVNWETDPFWQKETEHARG